MTEFDEDIENSSETNTTTEEYIWTHAAGRPTGEDIDNEREKMVKKLYSKNDLKKQIEKKL